MNSDMPEAGKMPYGIPESAYVEIKDKQFSADVVFYKRSYSNVE